ncbi:LCP family protein [Micromonospora sp. C28SCA-DRY-2]|uniref:LCP family protein n=1 Tax=Micromonospora sp. C28SCA-DRY-2 TaxID=3059522 RepID=UPI00267661C7|nr:LCP family protein [Micromonospora sp. C28SCA-DRY-2]MDO3706043.1 LCP family protein [Micromonospora sp. C28SCA-DRY-2]
MIEDDLRAAFARHEPLTPPTGPVRAAIARLVAVRRRRRRRLGAGGAALALLALLGVGIPQFTPDRVAGDATLLVEPGRRAPAGALNVLLLGVDSRGDEMPPLADSVLLVHIPADRSRPYLVSLSRDLEVAIPGYGRDKLNAAAAYGARADGGLDLARGYELIRRTVTDLTGVRVDAGAVITFPVLRQLTDLLSGVEVCLPQRVRSSHTDRVFPAGCQRLDGRASLDLLRQRRDLPDGGVDRDRNAQRFAAGLIRRAGEQGVLHDPVRFSRILAELDPELTVATTGGSVLDLVQVVPELASVEPVGLSLPAVVSRTGDRWVLRPDPAAAPAFLAALREDRLAQWAGQHPERVTRLH